MKKYIICTDGKIDRRVYEGDPIPEGFYKGSHYKKVPWNKGLNAEHDDRVKANSEASSKTRRANNSYVAWNKGLTKEIDDRVLKNTISTKLTVQERYGVDNISQHISKQSDYQVWNKGLTKETDERMKKASDNHKGCHAWNKGLVGIYSHTVSEETRKKLRAIHLDPDFQQRRYLKMKKNGTLFVAKSVAEEQYFSYLKSVYSEDDIIRQYFDKERYPFKCDFYIKSEDLFIEIHANWTHGGRPYDPEDVVCQRQLEYWKEKSLSSKFYQNAIYQWTDLDVRKAEIARKNKLNFKVIY